MSEPMNDREFVEWATGGYELGSRSYPAWKRLSIIASHPGIPYPDCWPSQNWQLLCLIATLRLGDEASQKLAAAECRIVEVNKLLRELFDLCVYKGSILTERHQHRILSALSEERKT